MTQQEEARFLWGMKLNQSIHHNDGYTITRVPGGWIYRFYQIQQDEGPSGSYSENYREQAVFVPLNNEFLKEQS
jgi:hypothetical protein